MRDTTALTADLRALGGQRVWSLMISLFGDLAQGKGDQIDGPVLSAIMAALDVKPEAARVALHRLRNDGWIRSTKSGRISRHSLTAKGRAEIMAASPRIYARPDDGDADWQLVLLRSGDAETLPSLLSAGFVPILPRVHVGPVDASLPPDVAILKGRDVPSWLREEVAASDLAEDYRDLHRILTALAAGLPDADTLSSLEIAVLRCLIVHNWRRLILKHPRLPRAFVSDSNPMQLAHVIVIELLDRYPRPALHVIAQEHAAA